MPHLTTVERQCFFFFFISMTSLYPTNDSYFSLQDGTVSDAEAGFYLSGSESFSQEDFLASGWPIIKPILDNPPAVTESEYLEQF